MTFMMRPSVPAPTGTAIGTPVSVTSWPRIRPSEMSMAMQRTELSPRCCATSSTSRVAVVLGLQRIENLRQMAVELHVDDGADHLGDAAGRSVGVCHVCRPRFAMSPALARRRKT